MTLLGFDREVRVSRSSSRRCCSLVLTTTIVMVVSSVLTEGGCFEDLIMMIWSHHCLWILGGLAGRVDFGGSY